MLFDHQELRKGHHGEAGIKTGEVIVPNFCKIAAKAYRCTLIRLIFLAIWQGSQPGGVQANASAARLTQAKNQKDGAIRI
jgi:hypothetical protein